MAEIILILCFIPALFMFPALWPILLFFLIIGTIGTATDSAPARPTKAVAPQRHPIVPQVP